jgi:hypothetical protein
VYGLAPPSGPYDSTLMVVLDGLTGHGCGEPEPPVLPLQTVTLNGDT